MNTLTLDEIARRIRRPLVVVELLLGEDVRRGLVELDADGGYRLTAGGRAVHAEALLALELREAA